MNANVEEVPGCFRPRIKFDYPKHNDQIFESYLMDYVVNNDVHTARRYLPVGWTSLYVNRNFGNDSLEDLQVYLNGLDRNRKYFTVVQYDDGILNDLSGLDLFVFAQAGHGPRTRDHFKYDYVLPVNCKPAPNINVGRDRDIFCSYYCNYNIHPIRNTLRAAVEKKAGYVVGNKTSYESFSDILERSVFSMCPRGYSATTFKICECLQRGTIPVFVYDKPWVPFEDRMDMDSFCVSVHESEIPNIDDILKALSKSDVRNMVEAGREAYATYYKYDACAKVTIDIINNS